MIVRGKDIPLPLRESADVCIVGSGCGGGASARTLAGAGKKVILLEEGGYFTSTDFDGTEATAYQNLYQRRAGQATEDLGVTVLQGRCVGGSTVVNWMTSLRTPEFTLEDWRRRFGIEGLGARDLEPYFERIERYLNVHPEPDGNHNANNRIILDGARALGYRTRANGRNARGCVKSGACGLGCPFDAKLSVALTYIPDAVKQGASVFADCRAEKIELRGNMKRVTGNVLDTATRRPVGAFSVEAPVVIVAASAINTPVLLLKSGIANRSGEVGKNLTFHLTTAVAGRYERVIYPSGGIPQSVFCDQFLNSEGDSGGFWIEAVPVYPALAALAFPGFGRPHKEEMKEFPHTGASIVLVKEIDSAGRVTVNDRGRASIDYRRGPKDLEYMKQGVAASARMHFAAGAKEVMTLHASPTIIRSPGEIERKIRAASWERNDIALFSAHPLGTCRMGTDPRSSVVDPHGQTHDVGGLFVMDGSVTPTSLGVNPQITLLALAEKSAEWIADNFIRAASRTPGQ
ncbi:MAG TPA: GMC family oxidoreductase [Bacteroidota bacterium]|nr:GMC family oxidoreductase [Bacteroidota bacterium]